MENDIRFNGKHMPPRYTLNRGQIELYKYLKSVYDAGNRVKRSEILKLYLGNVRPNKRATPRNEIDEEKLYQNATIWMNTCIVAFVRRGYVQLGFNVTADDIDRYHGSSMGNQRAEIKDYKKQGSKAFKRALTERNNKIGESMNRIDLTDTREVVCENLKNVKKNTRGRMRKKFMNKLQRWSYVKVLDKLSQLTEEAGVVLNRINPAYTSQKCSRCGVIEKSNRKGKKYQCACGLEIDADYNAAINISHMGAYSPYALC